MSATGTETHTLQHIFPSGIPKKILYEFFVCPLRASYLTHLALLYLVPLIIFCEDYKL
jgi:hypothetical protein